MTLDVFFLQALVEQLNQRLAGSLVKKIYQTDETQLVFRFWTGRSEVPLLLCCEVGRARLHETSISCRNPLQPPRFCQLLRARLYRLERIELLDEDRLVALHFCSQDDMSYCLLLELFGRSPKLLLLDDQQRIVDLMRRVEDERYAPGSPYQRPLKEGMTALEQLIHPQFFSPRFFNELSQPFDQWLLQQVSPMSRAVAQTLAEEVRAQDCLQPVIGFVGAWQQGLLLPVQRGKVMTMREPAADEAVSQDARPDLSAWLEARLGRNGNEEPDRLAIDEALSRAVTAACRKLEKRRLRLETELVACGRAQDWQREGELLAVYRHLIRRGMTQVCVDDFYADPPMARCLPLDPVLSVQENIDARFHRARRARRGLTHCRQRLDETEQEQQWLDTLRLQIETADRVADLELLRQDLIAAGYYRPTRPSEQRRRAVSADEQVRRARTPGGLEILWGRNSRTNDYLSRQLLGPRDVWMHVHGAPGCHLVVKSDSGSVTEEDVLYAASIAAFYSSMRHETWAEVMVTDGKSVRHIKGARPGQVQVSQYRIVRVAPSVAQEVEASKSLSSSANS
ncbi:MAG: NFACT family protein [Desulfuromonadaceae bacterium]|nr:NFACT family protein [Desulfuromonadaceae bacterium]